MTLFNLPALPKAEKVDPQSVPVPKGAGPGQSALALGLGTIGAGISGNPGFLNAIAQTLQMQQQQIQEAQRVNASLKFEADRANVQITNTAMFDEWKMAASAMIQQTSDERQFEFNRELRTLDSAERAREADAARLREEDDENLRSNLYELDLTTSTLHEAYRDMAMVPPGDTTSPRTLDQWIAANGPILVQTPDGTETITSIIDIPSLKDEIISSADAIEDPVRRRKYLAHAQRRVFPILDRMSSLNDKFAADAAKKQAESVSPSEKRRRSQGQLPIGPGRIPSRSKIAGAENATRLLRDALDREPL